MPEHSRAGQLALLNLPHSGWPVIILVEPQLGENIGATARAMWNCGLSRLRLVSPREEWPNPRAVAMASGADIVLERAQLFDTVAEATADLRHLYATTARERDMAKPALSPRALAGEIDVFRRSSETCGVLFGAERSGLRNEDVVRAEGMVHLPANPAFSSFNLAQAVLIVAYECLLASGTEDDGAPSEGHANGAAPKDELATVGQVNAFLEHLDRELDEAEYYREPNLRATMQRNLHNIFRRARLTDQEVRSLRGVVARLARWRVRRPPDAASG